MAAQNWYRDPNDPDYDRFWTGIMWSEERRTHKDGTPTFVKRPTARTAAEADGWRVVAALMYILAIAATVGVVIFVVAGVSLAIVVGAAAQVFILFVVAQLCTAHGETAAMVKRLVADGQQR